MPFNKKNALLTGKIVLAIITTATLVFLFIPYEKVKLVLDSFAVDGNVESFQQLQFSFIKIIAVSVFILFGTLLYFLHFRPKNTEIFFGKCLITVKNFLNHYIVDFRNYLVTIHNNLPSKTEKWFVVIILVFGIIVRYRLLTRPIEYDEAYTYNEFARHSLKYILSEYYVVNNHIFHTILVKLSTSIFGAQPWAIRLPVFFAGILLIFACYQLARKLFNNTNIARIAAILTTCLPILLDKSVSARAYMLIALFFITSLNIALDLIKEKNRFAWSLIIVLVSLGVFANPIMLYPFSILFMWLAILGLLNLFGHTYNKLDWFKYIFSATCLAGLLSIIFYSQIFKHYGLLTVFNGNQVVDPLPFSAFLNQFPAFLFSIYIEWKTGISKLLFIIIFSFYVISLFLAGSEKKATRILLVLFPVLPMVLIFIQKPTIIARIWLWMVPLLLIGSAAGIYKIYLLSKSKFYRIPVTIILLTILSSFLYSSIKFTYPIPYQREIDSSITITEYLQNQINNDDIVVVSMYEDAKYWYYFNLWGLPETSIRGIKQRPFARAFVIVYPNNYEDLDQVVSEFGPDKVFLDRSSDNMVFTDNEVYLYEIQANEIAIQDQFK